MSGKVGTVLYVCNGDKLYGSETSLLEAATVLLSRFRLLFLLPGPGPYQRAIEARGMRVLYYRRVGRDGNEEFARRLREVIGAHEVGLVHTNKAFAGGSGLAATVRRVTRETGLPMVVHVRGWHCGLDSEYKRLLAQVERVICVSWATRRKLLAGATPVALRQRARRIEVVYNGRNLSRLRFSAAKRSRIRRRLGVADGQVLIGLVGRFDPGKGPAPVRRAGIGIPLPRRPPMGDCRRHDP